MHWSHTQENAASDLDRSVSRKIGMRWAQGAGVIGSVDKALYDVKVEVQIDLVY